MKILGILFITIALIIAWWHAIKRKKFGDIITCCIITIFAGGFFFMNDRVTEISFKDYWKIKTVAKQVQIDAQAVDSLRQRIENQSATIDLISRKAIKAEVELNLLDSTIIIANEKIDELNKISDISLLILAAQNDYRFAFDSLKILSKDVSYTFSGLAEHAYNEIMNKHNPFIVEDGFIVPWNDDVDHLKLNINELRKEYDNAPAGIKPALIEYIWKRDDFQRIDRLDFLIYVIKFDSSLIAVEYAGRYFASETNLKYKPLATEFFIEWWEENRNKYLDK